MVPSLPFADCDGIILQVGRLITAVVQLKLQHETQCGQ